MPIKKGGIVTGKASKGANNTRNANQRKKNAESRKKKNLKNQRKTLAAANRAAANWAPGSTKHAVVQERRAAGEF